ncbi:hypothetical protein PR048_019176 [Dryococelus australis]|uniref:Integrase zinc-binding domain-containing protein n=1 Tax=Dryococelus australis TaxID=614101 RepID=A0ABQ9H2R5_9NEOP|nr:hypothetical protein PR048_019176 [Dryococelus australis]
MKGRGKWEVPEKTRRTTAPSDTIPTCENPWATQPGIESGSPWWEASSLTITPPRPQKITVAVDPFTDWPRKALGKGPVSDRLRHAVKASLLGGLPAMTGGHRSNEKIDVKHVYSEVDFAIGSQWATLSQYQTCKETRSDCPTARSDSNYTVTKTRLYYLQLFIAQTGDVILKSQGVSEEIWTALNIEVLREDEGDGGKYGQHRNEGARETGDPRENQPTNGIVTINGTEMFVPVGIREDEGEASSACKGGEKRDMPEKTRRKPVASSGTIPKCEVAPPGIERGDRSSRCATAVPITRDVGGNDQRWLLTDDVTSFPLYVRDCGILSAAPVAGCWGSVRLGPRVTRLTSDAVRLLLPPRLRPPVCDVLKSFREKQVALTIANSYVRGGRFVIIPDEQEKLRGPSAWSCFLRERDVKVTLPHASSVPVAAKRRARNWRAVPSPCWLDFKRLYQLCVGCPLSQWKATIGPAFSGRFQSPCGPMAKIEFAQESVIAEALQVGPAPCSSVTRGGGGEGRLSRVLLSSVSLRLERIKLPRARIEIIHIVTLASDPFQGATVAERLTLSPPTKASRAQYPAGSPNIRKWESCRTMPVVGGSSRGSLLGTDRPVVGAARQRPGSIRAEIKPFGETGRGEVRLTTSDSSALVTASRGGIAVRLLASHQGFLLVGIELDDAAGRRVSSEISRFPRSCIPALLPSHLVVKSCPNLSTHLSYYLCAWRDNHQRRLHRRRCPNMTGHHGRLLAQGCAGKRPDVSASKDAPSNPSPSKRWSPVRTRISAAGRSVEMVSLGKSSEDTSPMDPPR